MHRQTPPLVRCILLASVLSGTPGTAVRGDTALEATGLRLNELQVIGTHNSYKAAIDPPLLRLLEAANPDANGFDYRHAPLDEQLDLGLRSLELDFYHDPVGGRYAVPLGLRMLAEVGSKTAPFDPEGRMKLPGFKVLHVADVDFRSNYALLSDALEALRSWSAAHPTHLPVVVTVNLKEDKAPLAGGVEPLRFDGAALDLVDATIREGLDVERLITPDSARGTHATLEAMALARDWPLVDDSRGKFLWVLDAGDPLRSLYASGHASLAGRVMFTTHEPGSPEAAFLIVNDPVADGERIAEWVRRGYVVRTRADAETREARAGERSRFEAAQRCGAQVISTDYPTADERLGTGYRVRFAEGYARRNPVTAAATTVANP